MMKITKLRRTKKKGRLNVFLDGKYSFTVFEFTLIKFNLYKGKEIHNSDIDIIKVKDLELYLKRKILRLIVKRPRSEFEAQQFLNRLLYKDKVKGKSELIKRIIKDLRKKDYLNDTEFAKWWVRTRMKYKPRGKYLIVSELKSKGISEEIIEKAITEEEFSGEKEVDFARMLGEKKLRMLSRVSDKMQRKRKFLSFLVGKGFSYEISYKTYDKLKNEFKLVQ